MYLIECNYICDNFVKPWKVILRHSYSHQIIETQRFYNNNEVINKIKAYLTEYNLDDLQLVEYVYWPPHRLPRLDILSKEPISDESRRDD